MRILFDQGTPAPLRHLLSGHQVETAYDRGWSSLENGELITAAEQAGFELFVTTDRNLKYQQNLVSRKLSIVVLLSTSWPRIQLSLPAIVSALNAVVAGSVTEITIE